MCYNVITTPWQQVKVSQAHECILGITVAPHSDSGGHKVKVTSVVVNEDLDNELGIGNGAAFDYAVANGLCFMDKKKGRLCRDSGDNGSQWKNP
jgi:hypothetical protein